MQAWKCEGTWKKVHFPIELWHQQPVVVTLWWIQVVKKKNALASFVVTKASTSYKFIVTVHISAKYVTLRK